MSVREQLYLRTEKSPPEVAALLAEAAGGRVEGRDGTCWLLFATDRLVNGVAGDFGGPVLEHESDLLFRPEGEFEAADCYNIEIRLWQVGGPRAHPATGIDVEEAAASALFNVVTTTGIAAIQIHEDENLVRAVLPGIGAQTFPTGTSVYDWDADKWGGYVLRPPDRNTDRVS